MRFYFPTDVPYRNVQTDVPVTREEFLFAPFSIPSDYLFEIIKELRYIKELRLFFRDKNP